MGEMHELNNSNVRLTSENDDLSRQLEDAESKLNSLTKVKNSLAKNFDETKALLEDETKQKSKLHGENKILQSDLDRLKEQADDDSEAKAEIQRHIVKITNEINIWKQKFESGDGSVSNQIVDDLKRKLMARIAELEEEVESLDSKNLSLEKAKNRLQGEVEDCSVEMERAQV